MDSPDRLIGRFRADWTCAWPEANPVGLAVSGGPDSLALLLLARQALPDGFAVATVDHGLRAESADEAASVAALCASLGIPHATLRVHVARGRNLQAAARAARYAALADWARERGFAAVATAHHADDQAETLLMRLNRGAGARGLAAMRARAPLPGAPELMLLRPLLGWRRDELSEVIASAGVDAASDPSNADTAFERVRVRNAISRADWLDAAMVAASASALGDADDAIEWAADQEWRNAVTIERGEVRYCPSAPRAVRLRILERVLGTAGSSTPRGAEVARWLDALEAGRTATLAGVQGRAALQGWVFRPVPPPRT